MGQRFVRLLEGHPWFEVAALVGSARSAGRPYGEACRWVVKGDMPEGLGDAKVLGPDDPLDAPLVFSALRYAAVRRSRPAVEHTVGALTARSLWPTPRQRPYP